MAARSVLIGRYAEISIGASPVVLALCTKWELTVDTDTVESVAHGEIWKKPLTLDSGWEINATGYVVPGSAAHYINQFYLNTGSAQETLYTVTCWSGATTSGTKIFEGTAKATKGRLTADMTLAEQEITLTGYDTPTTGV